MENSSLPIDPKECELRLERPSPMLATLAVRVPASLVKRFRKKMRKAGREADLEELRTGLVQFCITQGFTDPDLRAVSMPGWMPGTTPPVASPDRDFEATIAVDVATRIEVPDAAELEFELPEATVTDAMVEDEVASQCRVFGTRSPALEVTRGCDCVLDAELLLAEQEKPVLAFQKALAWVPIAGRNLVVAGLALPGAVDALCGAKAGESRQFVVPYPATGPLRFIRGTPVLARVTVREARAVQPAAVERVLSEYGMPNEARLRTQIRFALEAKLERDAQAVLRQQMSEHLVRLARIDLPTIRGAAGRAAAEKALRDMVKGRGLVGDAATAEFNRLLPVAHERADFTSKLEYIIRSVAHEIKVGMDEDIVAGRLAGAAAEAGVRPEVLRAELVRTGQYKEYVERLYAELALDRLLLNAKPRRIPAAEWEARHSGMKA